MKKTVLHSIVVLGVKKRRLVPRVAWPALLGIACLLGALPGRASASLFGFDLQSGNAALTGYSPNYAEVDINLTTPTTATIKFSSLNAGGNIYLLGDGGTVGVNVHASHWTLGTITGSNSGTGFTLGGPYSDGGSGHEDGFGVFNQTIDTFDGYTHSSDTVSFTLTNTSGTWSSAADVLTPNGSGELAAAHIFVTTMPANASGSALVTGFASGDGTVPPGPNFEIRTPEPSSMVLAGLAVACGVFGCKWRRRHPDSSLA